MWEVLNRQIPYPGLDDVGVLFGVTKEELHPNLPDQTVYPLYNNIMRDIFKTIPDARPTFYNICDILKNNKGDYITPNSSKNPSPVSSNQTATIEINNHYQPIVSDKLEKPESKITNNYGTIMESKPNSKIITNQNTTPNSQYISNYVAIDSKSQSNYVKSSV